MTFLGYESSIQLGKNVGMLFNAEKNEHLSITGNAQNSNSHRIDMESTKIPKVTTHKHLGITVNSTLSWSDHIKSVYINCARKIEMLKRLKRKLHPSAFKRIYTGAIRPKMEYACTVWSGGPTSKLVDLQNFELSADVRHPIAVITKTVRLFHTCIIFYSTHTPSPKFLV